VDTDFEQAENKELAPLADLEPRAPAEIVRLAEHDGELLHWFYDQGFVPGSQTTRGDVEKAAGSHAEKATAGLFVRAA
jgi:hypothetical protein